MAEEALYDNLNEPKFPFELVAKNAEWLAGELEAASLKESPYAHYEFELLLNIVFVWTRARTATWWGNFSYEKANSLVASLNAILEEAGEEATYHRLELVPRLDGMFWVTCRNSPRFNWKSRPTHLEIGQNLDFFGAGHVFDNPGPSGGRVGVDYVERITGRQIIAEVVSYDMLLADPASLDRFKVFCYRKEALFNKTMERLGLKYRFKCHICYPQDIETIQPVMNSSIPPTQEWWDDHFHILNSPNQHVIIQYCRFESQYSDNWELVRYVYAFMLTHVTRETYDLFSRLGKEQWKRMDKKIEEVDVALLHPPSPERSESLLADLRKEFSDFAVTEENLRKRPVDYKKESKFVLFYQQFRRRVSQSIVWVRLVVRAFFQDVYMHMFERWKLRKPLVWNNGLGTPGGPLCCAHEWGYWGRWRN